MTSRNCEKYRALMVEYLAGEMDDPEAAVMDRHLAECPGCSQELAALKTVMGRLDQAVQEMPPPPAGLVARALARVQGQVRLGWLGRPVLAGAVLAAVFTLLLVGPIGESEIQAPSPGGQGEMSIKMKGGEEGRQPRDTLKAEDWVAVFTGDARTAREAADKLAQAGIRHQVRTSASQAVVTVPSGDLEMARQIIFTPDTP